MSMMVTFWCNKKKQMNQSESTANRVSVLLYAVLHTNLELSSQLALSQLPRITSDPLVPFQSILQCNSGHENEYITTILVTSQNLVQVTFFADVIVVGLGKLETYPKLYATNQWKMSVEYIEILMYIC